MQDFGNIRVHPCAFSGGKNDKGSAHEIVFSFVLSPPVLSAVGKGASGSAIKEDCRLQHDMAETRRFRR
jgi:hypothetical protein